jgi:hypothetical protein
MRRQLMLARVGYLLVIAIILVPSGNAQTAAGIPRHGKLNPLFNGKDFSGFDIFLDKQPLNNPDKVFQVEHGTLYISGAVFGGLVTKKEYENYYLRAEFKWGEMMCGHCTGKARDSGIQYHINGPLVIWPRMMEFQISEGGTGDIWLIQGPSLEVRGQLYQSTSTPGASQYVRIARIGRGEIENVTGFRSKNEVENAHGEWNTVELIADHDHIMQYVNGKLVNEGTHANATSGKIDFESEGAEIYFRNMVIASLK